MSVPVAPEPKVLISTGRRCIQRGDELVYPRAKAFDLLMFLAGRRGAIVSRQEISERLWPGTAVCDHSVSQCIWELRQALADDPRNPRFIRTAHRVGFEYIGPPVESLERKGQEAGPKPAASRIALGAVLAIAVASGPINRGGDAREVARWCFDEGGGTSVEDSSGRGASGSVLGPFSRVAGVSGTAFRFDSLFTAVSGMAPELPAGASPRTVSAWVRAVPAGDSSAIFYYGLVHPVRASKAFGLWIDEHGVAVAGPLFYTPMVFSSKRVDDNRWHLLTATYEGPPGNLLRLYVDGRRESSLRLASPPETVGTGEWRAGRFVTHGVALRGAIDDVRVWRSALTAERVAALYAARPQGY